MCIRDSRKSGSIATLARDVCAVGISAGNWFAGEAAEIAGHPEYRPVPAISRTPAVAVEAVYQGDPVLRPDVPTELSLAFTNHSTASIALAVEVRAPEGVLFTPGEIQLTLQPHERYPVSYTHLDVYKRQGFVSIFSRKRRICTSTVRKSPR